MVRRDLVHLIRPDVGLCAVRHANVEHPGQDEVQVVVHAPIGPCDRFHGLLPGPARFHDHPADDEVVHLEDLGAASLVRADLVGMVKPLVLEPGQRTCLSSGGRIARLCHATCPLHRPSSVAKSSDHLNTGRHWFGEPLNSRTMKIAHIRERNAPSGSPWRLAAAREPGPNPQRWLDLEEARQGLLVENPQRAHNSPLFRQSVTTLDDHLARALRVETLAELVEGYARAADDDEAVLDAADLEFGPPILRPPSLRDFYAFEGHVRTMWERRGGTVPEAWYRIPIFYFSNVSEIRGPNEPIWCPAASQELDYELEVAALIDTPVHDLDAKRCRGSDWRVHDLQRLVGSRPAARRDRGPAGAGQGQGFRHLDRSMAGDPRRAGGCTPRQGLRPRR